MRDNTAFAKAPGRLLLLWLAMGVAPLEAACMQLTKPLDASSATSLPPDLAGARQLPLELAFVPGEVSLAYGSHEGLQRLLECAAEAGLHQEILLVVGYAAPAEAGNAALLALAHDRADFVVRQLHHAGLVTAGIRAVQSSPTDERQSFARVELWLRE
jgi:hypothetical protein